MAVKRLLLFVVAWLLGRWASAVVPTSSPLSYDSVGDYVTVFLIKPFSVFLFVLLNVAGLYLVRQGMYAYIRDWRTGLHTDAQRFTIVMVPLLGMLVCGTFFLRHPMTTMVILSVFMVVDLRRLWVYRRNRVKLKRLFGSQ